MEPKQKRHPVVDVTGDGSKVRCCKEQYCIGTWNVRSMNQGKLEVIKQEMARVNVNILGISKLKCTGMGEFNSDDHYIYYCGKESLRKNGVDIISSVQFSRSVVSDTLQPHGLHHARLPCPSPTPGSYSDSCPLSRWCHPTISSFVVPFSSHLQSFLASGSFPVSQFITSGGQILEFQLRHQSFQWIFKTGFLLDGLVASPCSPRDSQESSPIPQFRSINNMVLSFLYSPILTSIHDYWKNHSLD